MQSRMLAEMDRSAAANETSKYHDKDPQRLPKAPKKRRRDRFGVVNALHSPIIGENGQPVT